VGESGAELSFRFKGRRILIYDLLGPDGCGLEISVDGQISSALRIDGFCIYHRLAVLKIGDGIDPGISHTIHIKVLPDKIDKEKILFEHHRSDLREHPEKYAENKWHAAAIFLDGEIVHDG
jgi:hypothetical protein